MKNFYKIGVLIFALIISQQAFPQKENAKGTFPSEQQINLSEGYSFISSRIIAENPDMQDILQDNLVNLDFVRNTAGDMLRKIGPNWVNGIGNWVNTEGYLFRMNDGDEISIIGDEIYPQTPIDLSYGFQLIGYLPEQNLNTELVFQDVLENLDFVRDSDGQMFVKIGPNWVNSIGDMQPGEGYLVKMLADDVLIYPSSSFSCGDPITDIDGNTYNTVQIGVQCWMAENLKTTKYQNGTSIQNVTNAGSWNNLTTGAYVWYDNDITWKNLYGALYNWYAVDDPNGLCQQDGMYRQMMNGRH